MKYQIPENPPPPGRLLRNEFLTPLGMTQTELAQRLHIPTTRVSGICNGKKSITAETAVLLSKFFGNSAQFWLNAQNAYDIANLKIKTNNIKPLKLPRVALA